MGEAILVTGGAGYIGSHVCKALAQAGFLPITYDNLSTGHAYAVKWGPFVQADLADVAVLRQTFEKFRPKAVLHFAASALVIESICDPGKYYRNNLTSSIALLEAMRDFQVPYLIFSSTCATYGQPQYFPLNEAHPQLPINPYGKSKLMVEEMIKDFETAHGICSGILRYFNIAGADLETEIGENHEPETHIVPNVIQAALGLKEEVVVYGTDFPSPDGSAVRDYIHVVDLAHAHVAALKTLLESKKSFCVNLGTGHGYSVLEVIDAVQTFCGKEINVKLLMKREGEPSHLTADYSLAKKLLGWQPTLGLPEMIASAWKWHKFLLEHEPLLRAALDRMKE